MNAFEPSPRKPASSLDDVVIVEEKELEPVHVFEAESTLPPSVSKGVISSACSERTLFSSVIVVVLVVAAVALHFALTVYRPPVWFDKTPKSPSGYFYGGAVYQGSGIWITGKPSLPSARADMSATTIGEKIYILGGSTPNQTILSETLEFDPAFERFSNDRQPIPVPRYRHAATAYGNELYILGGMSEYDGVPLDRVDVYNVVSNEWSTTTSLSLPRSDSAAAAMNNRIYIFGGYGVDYDMSVVGSLVEEYDIITKIWRTRAPMITPRGDVSAVAFGNRIFVLGGWNDIDNDFQVATEAFTPSKNQWTSHAHMISAKGDLAAVVYKGSIFNIGGEVWSGTTDVCPWDHTQICKINEVPTHDCISFSPDTDPASITERSGVNTAGSIAGRHGGPGVWVPHAPNPGARYRFSGAAVESSQAIWVFGGTKNEGEVVDSVSAFYDTVHPPVFIHYKE